MESRTIQSEPAAATSLAFRFERDTFAFPNELVWQYRFDVPTGRVTTFWTDPPPTYSHRCFVMVRSTRQFLYHARFEPDEPAPDVATLRSLIRQVVARSPRRPCAEQERIVIPGYAGLRELSQSQESLVKSTCGGPWQSYFLRSHWRMVFPVWRRHQEKISVQLKEAFPVRTTPLVHLFRFPRITINHGIVLFGCTDTGQDIQFEAYDPNIPERPVTLIYRRASRSFYFPHTHYWAGGKVSVIEIYQGWCY